MDLRDPMNPIGTAHRCRLTVADRCTVAKAPNALLRNGFVCNAALCPSSLQLIVAAISSLQIVAPLQSRLTWRSRKRLSATVIVAGHR